ncbi:MAG: viperin family antiviral radical SAM protein [Burkholderiaceae bacterium]|nr:viperin family antiviral radical SAM protein [Burkholderiaceae bacterium]
MVQPNGSACREVRSPIVINWHVTEACNYRCAYCYAHWDRPQGDETIRNPQATEALVRSIHEAFSTGITPERLRLNFAGGEPLLFDKQVLAAMKFAAGLGFDSSLITNGSRLSRQVVSEFAPLLKVLGVSLDADGDLANTAIGRADSRGRPSPVRLLPEMIAFARAVNPQLTIKINTVVNAINWHLDLSAMIERLNPDQWKVLRMLPSTTRHLEVTKEQFESFLKRHARFRSLMRIEDNDAMVESYVMVDPHGRFFQNGQRGFGYAYSPAILDVGARDAFRAVTWVADKFAARYESPAVDVAQ